MAAHSRRAIRRIAFATHCQSFHLHFVRSESSASRTFFSPNLATRFFRSSSISAVIGARSSGGMLNFLLRVLPLESFAWRGLCNRVRTVQFNNEFRQHYGFLSAFVAET